ncbi:442aa long hypothetical protein [Pyrococcus horikoshii OT3]|uniref:NurA domain-containing protein n=2 Tax=Pyrococcus horikoshii TaxID=53953 RepID=O58688_PYRHO|nr:442aa long hypothetical protein [Pyrococcus horikoshii OT3]
MEKIADILIAQLNETLRNVNYEVLLSNWKALPEAERSSVYAVDGSRSVTRLSGTIVYFLSAIAIGSGRSYKLFYANAMQYNHGVSDQVVRMQMETMENMIGYLAEKMLRGEKKLILMDGTLTGSLIRPPVYPEDIKSIAVIRSLIGINDFDNLIYEYVKMLEEHYREVRRKLKDEGTSDAPLLSDVIIDKFRRKYLETRIIGHIRNKVRVKVPSSIIKREGVPLSLLERFLEEGKSLEDALREIKEERVEVVIDKDMVNDAFHILLTYIEYLYSLDKLLEVANLAYIAKSFYTKKLANMLGIPIVDTALLDIVLRRFLKKEKEGYWSFEEPVRIPHEIPEYLINHFKNVKKFAERGVNIGYVRFERGDVIYMVQSTKKIEDILPLILHHRVGGYIRPLQLAHDGAKISYKEARMALDALINYLRNKDPELKVFTKYGRSPLE